MQELCLSRFFSIKSLPRWLYEWKVGRHLVLKSIELDRCCGFSLSSVPFEEDDKDASIWLSIANHVKDIAVRELYLLRFYSVESLSLWLYERRVGRDSVLKSDYARSLLLFSFELSAI